MEIAKKFMYGREQVISMAGPIDFQNRIRLNCASNAPGGLEEGVQLASENSSMETRRVSEEQLGSSSLTRRVSIDTQPT